MAPKTSQALIKKVKSTAIATKKGKKSLAMNPPRNRFTSQAAVELYKSKTIKRSLLSERGFLLDEKNIAEYPSFIIEKIKLQGWEKFATHPDVVYPFVVKEVHANLPKGNLEVVFFRGNRVQISADVINEFYGLEPPAECHFEVLRNTSLSDENYKHIIESICHPGAQWVIAKTKVRTLVYNTLLPEAKIWSHFVTASLSPTTHATSTTTERAILIYCIMCGFRINVGQLIAREIIANLEKTKSIYFPFVISGLMKPHFNEEEEDKEIVGKILDPKAVKKIMANLAGATGATSAKEEEDEETESNEKTEGKAESVPVKETEEISSIKLIAVKQEKGEAMAKATKKKAAKPASKGTRKSSRGAEKAFSESHKKMSEEGVINVDNSPPDVVVSQKEKSPHTSPVRTAEPTPPVAMSAASATEEAAAAVTASSQEEEGKEKEPEEVTSGEKNLEERSIPQPEEVEEMGEAITTAESDAIEKVIAAIVIPEASKEMPVKEGLTKEAEPLTTDPQVPILTPLNLGSIESEKEKEKEEKGQTEQPQILVTVVSSSKILTPVVSTKANEENLNKDGLKRKQPMEVELSSSEELPPLKRPKLVTSADLEIEVGKIAAQIIELKDKEIGGLRTQVAMLQKQLSEFISYQIRMERSKNQAGLKEIVDFMAQHGANIAP